MNDFLAILAAQTRSLAPVVHPLVPARYAPMPSIGGVGTLEGLRAGDGLAAPAPESPPPSLDRFAAPPPLVEKDAYSTAYAPFSYLQFQQAGVDQAVAAEPSIKPTAPVTDGEAVTAVERNEPALSAVAGQPAVLATSAPAGEQVHPAIGADSPPSHAPEPLVALSPTAAPSSSGELAQPTGESHQGPVLPPEIIAPPSVAPPPSMDVARSSALDAVSTRLASAPPTVAVPAAARRDTPAPDLAASPSSEDVAPPFPIQPAPGAQTDPLQAPLPGQSTSVVSRPEVVGPSLVARSSMDIARPSAPIEATAHLVLTPPNARVTPAAAKQPAAAAVERNAPAADSVPSPRPAGARAPEAPAGLSPHPQGVSSQPAVGAMPPALHPEMVTPPPSVRLSHADAVGAARKADAVVRVPPPLPDTAIGPSTVIEPSPIVPEPLLPAEIAQSSGSVFSTVQAQPAAGSMPLARRPEVVAPPPAAAIQRTAGGPATGLPAQASKTPVSAPDTAGQSLSLARPPESMASQLSRSPDQPAAAGSDQAPEQPAPAASVKPFPAALHAPSALLLPLQGLDLAQTGAAGPETLWSQRAGKQTVVRPVLPIDYDSTTGQVKAGRNMPAHEPAPLPTIRVTVGRIEVRSSTPALPSPANPPSRPRPALSLDDYLKQPTKVRP